MDRCLLLLAILVLLCGARAQDEPCTPGIDLFCNPIVVDTPATDPPATDPPATDPPATDPPAIDPPATDPPATDPPVDEPPVDEPPVDELSVDDPPADCGTGDEDDPCASLNCKNAGTCLVDEGKAICLCPPGFDGKRCQRRSRRRRCPKPFIGVCTEEKSCRTNKECRNAAELTSDDQGIELFLKRLSFRCCRTACGGKQCYRV